MISGKPTFQDLHKSSTYKDTPLNDARLRCALEFYSLFVDKLSISTDTDHALELTSSFGLSADQLTTLKGNGLKPEDIAGDPGTQHARVHELLHWFARLAEGRANSKWIRSHAYELAYYVATNNMNAKLDLYKVKQDAFMQGVNITAKNAHYLSD